MRINGRQGAIDKEGDRGPERNKRIERSWMTGIKYNHSGVWDISANNDLPSQPQPIILKSNGNHQCKPFKSISELDR
jgi:hypothetical protein